MTTYVPRWLYNMPKTDLHCHIGGSIRLNTILELAEQYHVDLGAKTEEELAKIVLYKNRENQKERNLLSYISRNKICESVMKGPEAFERVAYELCEDAMKDNCLIFEPRFAPTNYEIKGAAGEKDVLSLYQIVESTLKGINKAKKDFKIKIGRKKYDMKIGLIICGMKTDPMLVEKAAELAVSYQDNGVVGFDLAGPEDGHSPKDFIKAIGPVKRNFIPLTTHSGELVSVKSIAEAAQYLGAERIGHGVSLRESPKLMSYLDIFRKGIENCLQSNLDTGAVTCIATHPIRDYFQAGHRVCINTDNRTISDTNLNKEYLLLMNGAGFARDDVFAVAKNGIKSAFLPSKEKKMILNIFDAYVRQVQRDKSGKQNELVALD